jgi:AcrR family transcriptional regulator
VHRPLSRLEAQAQTRARLVDAAAQVFSTRGYASSSLRQVADEAGLTTGAIYSNFQGKAELAVAVLDAQLHRPQYDIFRRVDGSLPYDEQLRQASVLLLAELDAGAPWFRLELECVQEAQQDPALQQRLRDRHTAIRDELATGVVDRLAEIGARSTLPPYLLAATFMAATNGIALTRLYAPADMDETAVQHVLQSIALASIAFDDQGGG